MSGATHPTTRVGWREWVQVPSAGVAWVKAKVDTGARSSAVHAVDLERFHREGEEWVRFSFQPWQATDEDAVVLERRVVDERSVRSSNGQCEVRLVVLLELVLAGRELTAEMTLSNRDEMGFRMLIGREALSQGFLVDASQSYLGGRPDLATRRRNRGRG